MKYTRKEHADQIMAILKEYLGMDIDWDYANNEVHLSIQSYVQDALKHSCHIQPRRKQDQPHPHAKPIYGAKAQYTTDEDTSPAASLAEKKFILEVTGTFLYYARAVNATMLPARGSSQRSKRTPLQTQ